MKIRDVLDYVIELQEPAFSEAVLLRWLNQVEAEIQTEVLLLAVDGIVQYSAEDLKAEANTELIVPAPFSKLYEDYLLWRIALGQGEAERANNLETIYHNSYLAYVRFVCGTIDPGSGNAERMRYYLTAYQIAVKLGFVGSEEEWVKSLKGNNGEPGAGLRIVGQVASEDQLPQLENSETDIGKGYLVGSGSGALLYIWDGQDWFYKTQLSGKGEKGEKGEVGPQGPQGVQGEVGPQGPQGIQGKTGQQGQQGIQGETGPQGPVGPQGEHGAVGIHVGAEPPTDESVNVWIDTDEEAETPETGGAKSWNDLTDRPFYETITEGAEILPVTTITFSGGSATIPRGTYSGSYVDGQKYVIEIDGVQHLATAQYIKYPDDIFVITTEDKTYNATGYWDISGPHEDGAATIRICEAAVEIKNLDSKFLTMDEEVLANSNNPVPSKVLYNALGGKLDKKYDTASAGRLLAVGPTGYAALRKPDMTGATASEAGFSGFVPAPAAGDQDKVLHGDGTWKTPETGGDYIPIPTTAEVGQTIRVSAVDENGKPTAWEAVDMASGGAVEEVWEQLLDVKLEEEVQKIESGFFSKPQKKLRIVLDTLVADADTNYMALCIYTSDVNWNKAINFYAYPMPRKSAERSLYEVEPVGDGKVLISSYHSGGDLSGDEATSHSTLALQSLSGGRMLAKPVDAYGNAITEKLTGMHIDTYGKFAAGTRLRIWGVAL